MRRILEVTQNLVKLFMHHVGDTEVPDEYYVWACIAMIGACAGDRVWTQKFRTARIYPNLFTILIGPSGSGKGQAIKTCLRLIESVKRVHRYVGKTTGPHLARYLAKADRRVCFLINPELSSDVGSGDVAMGFMKTMTKLWEGEDYGEVHEGTVTSGHVVVKKPCVNWLAGTTKEWLMHSVTPELITGGAFARVALSWGVRNYDKRIPEPRYPDDYDEVVEFMEARLNEVSMMEGQFHKTQDALDRERHWYMQRPRPDDPAMEAAWNREHDLSLKLAMILSLADGTELVIDRTHIAAGQRLAAESMRHLPKLQQAARITTDNVIVHRVAELVKRHGRITHSHLLRASGGTAEQLRVATDTLIQSRVIMRTTTGTHRGGIMYAWMGLRKLDIDTEDEEEQT